MASELNEQWNMEIMEEHCYEDYNLNSDIPNSLYSIFGNGKLLVILTIIKKVFPDTRQLFLLSWTSGTDSSSYC